MIVFQIWTTLAMLLLATSTLYSQTVVTNTNDSGPGSLREAIANASSGSTITFGSSLSGQTILLVRGLVISSSLIIDASSLPDGLIIDGGGDGGFEGGAGRRCITIGANSKEINVTLNNLTIKNGWAGADEDWGWGGNLRIDHDEIVVLNSCQILNGRVKGASYNSHGGGIYIHGGALTLNSCLVKDNKCQSGSGGGIFSSGADLTLNSCSIESNQAGAGGGIVSGPGGPHGYTLFGTLIMNFCTVANNFAEGMGGGIKAADSSPVLNSCTIVNNTTQGETSFGGGIHSSNVFDPSSVTQLINCTISGNSALDAFGGGFYNDSGITMLTHCTVTNNFAPDGGGSGIADIGYWPLGTETILTATIVSGNINSDIDAQFPPNNVFSNGDNLVGSGDVVDGLTFIQPGDQTGISNPHLSSLRNFGGSTLTHLPLIGSPVIDSAAASSTDPATDQRGLPRSSGPSPDIGATEFQSGYADFQDANNDDIDDRIALLYQNIPNVFPAPDLASRLCIHDIKISGQELILTLETLPGLQYTIEGDSDLSFNNPEMSTLVQGTSSDFFREVSFSYPTLLPSSYFTRVILEFPNAP